MRECDVLDAGQVRSALAGCDLAYYLIHSMGDVADFADADRTAAAIFAQAAEANHLARIVYLGGIVHADNLSDHLASRLEVGQTLAAGSTPVTELRAGVVIGSGSVSFEMLRYLTEVLPVMVTPRWVETLTQPIAINDVLAYLTAVLDDDIGSHIYEIGGPDIVSYREMMQAYARVGRPSQASHRLGPAVDSSSLVALDRTGDPAPGRSCPNPGGLSEKRRNGS